MSDTESDNGADVDVDGGDNDNGNQQHNSAGKNLLVVLAWVVDLSRCCWYY
jgi:hypothetical protein